MIKIFVLYLYILHKMPRSCWKTRPETSSVSRNIFLPKISSSRSLSPLPVDNWYPNIAHLTDGCVSRLFFVSMGVYMVEYYTSTPHLPEACPAVGGRSSGALHLSQRTLKDNWVAAHCFSLWVLQFLIFKYTLWWWEECNSAVRVKQQ